MAAGILDVVLEPGADFQETLTYELFDAEGDEYDFSSGWTAKAQVRHHFSSTDIALEFVVDLSSPNEIEITAPAVDTAGLQDLFRKGVWDLELTRGANVIRLLQGRATVNPQVTRVGA